MAVQTFIILMYTRFALMYNNFATYFASNYRHVKCCL